MQFLPQRGIETRLASTAREREREGNSEDERRG